MPQIVSCPDCGRPLNVPDHLFGRNVKCPGCGKKFLADVGAPDDRGRSGRGAAFVPRPDDELPPHDYADRPRPRRRRDEDDDQDYPERRRDAPEPSRGEVRQGWRHVRMGVNLVIIAMWIAVGAIVTALTVSMMLMLFGTLSFAAIFGGFSANSPPTQQQASQAVGQAVGTGFALMIGFIMLWGVLILCGLAFAGLRITGLGFCMGVPRTRKSEGLKGLAIAAFCLAIAALVFPLTFLGVDLALVNTTIGGCAWIVGQMLSWTIGLGEFICFLLFLRGVAFSLRKSGLAQNILIYMIVVGVFFLIVLSSYLIFPLIASASVVHAASSANPNAAFANAGGAVGAMFVGGLVCSGLFLLIGVGLFAWDLALLYQVRHALDGWLDRN